MRRLPLIAVVLALVLTVPSACGGSGRATATARLQAAPNQTTAQPSETAKMICADEVQGEIATMLGANTTESVSPTWADQTYACPYVYPEGQLVLSVKELVDKAATDQDFQAREQQLGLRGPLSHVGDDGFIANNDSVVVRKDFKVLSVDVSKLPQSFGSPPLSRSDVAVAIAAVIMDCWVGS